MQPVFLPFLQFYSIMLTIHFFKKSNKKVRQEIENGHFKNVQNGKSQNTFTNNFLYYYYSFQLLSLLPYFLLFYCRTLHAFHLPSNAVASQ